MQRFLLGLLAFLSIGVALVAPVPWLFGLVEATADQPLFEHLVARYTAAPSVFLIHVGFGAVALLAGPWQLMPRLRARRPALHRVTGYAYAGAVALAGTAGVVMGPRAWSGTVAQVGFTTLAIAWLATTAIGLQRIIAGDRAGHRAWITRSFALTFAAVSLRLQALILGGAGVPDEIVYPIVAWSSWLPNLAVVHVLLARRNSAGATPVQRRNARVNELCSENPSR
jgi:hypothetical protein